MKILIADDDVLFRSQRTDAEFSHGVCPECFEKHIRPELDQLRASKAKSGTHSSKPKVR